MEPRLKGGHNRAAPSSGIVYAC